MKLDRPILNAGSPERNMAAIDTWIARSVDEITYSWGQIEKRMAELISENETLKENIEQLQRRITELEGE